ncbi:MAG: DNA polymerase III subunit gamma/tau [Clostridia bacterium]|nr:DNA polymerase III subunit gamma/tau [Clostridia bacterium]
MYKALYRKYRPQYFADVVGQPQVTVTLKNELMAGRISHAYLFTGSRGTGKTTCAKILAKAVNCLDPQDGDPCGRCAICRGLDDGSILDVVEIDAASNNGVDSIRALIEESNFTPASAKYRVYIIDEVHMLSVAAFNALLKTLEEPPPHVIFILATTEVHKLLPTILSRCQRFDFRRIAPEDIAERLEDVCAQEHVEIDHDAAMLIAATADGGMRDALSILDQCIGRSTGEITYTLVAETAGLAGRGHLAELAACIHRGDRSGALERIDALYKASKDMGRLCEELSGFFRNLMLIKTMKDASGVVNAVGEELRQMTKMALSMDLSTILHSLDAFQLALSRMKTTNKRTELEMTFIRLCSPELDTSPEALLRRIEALERGGLRVKAAPVQEAEVSVPQTPEELEVKPEVKPAARSRSASIEELAKKAEPFDAWPEIIAMMKEYSSSVATAFRGSNAYVSGDYMLIDASTFAFSLLKQASQRDKIREMIQQVAGRPYKLGPYKAPPKEDKPQNALDAFLQDMRNSGVEIEEK